jgi:hypothetical protein
MTAWWFRLRESRDHVGGYNKRPGTQYSLDNASITCYMLPLFFQVYPLIAPRLFVAFLQPLVHTGKTAALYLLAATSSKG